MTCQIDFQLVGCLCSIQSNDAELIRRVGLYANDARHSLQAEAKLTYRATRARGQIHFSFGGFELSRDRAFQVLIGKLQNDLADHLGKWVQFHGLCLDGPAGRTLLIGDVPAGLRSLALELWQAGGAVSSSSGLCVQGEVCVPWPLPLILQEKASWREPSLQPLVNGLRNYLDEFGRTCHVISPSDFGQDWIVAPAALARVIVVVANPGGQTRFLAASDRWLPERLAAAAHIFRPENPASRIRAMAELGRIVNHVPARMLAMGSARSAAGLILAQD